jgi:hypothetical protein
MFVLTPGEQRVVIFAVIALVIGILVKHHRDPNENIMPMPDSELSLTPLVSPTPEE